MPSLSAPASRLYSRPGLPAPLLPRRLLAAACRAPSPAAATFTAAPPAAAAPVADHHRLPGASRNCPSVTTVSPASSPVSITMS